MPAMDASKGSSKSQAKPKLTRAMLDAQLPGTPDPDLCFPEAPLIPSDAENLKFPAGVNTLREWGSLHFPSGKWKGRSFIAVYLKQPSFVSWYLSRNSFDSAWAKSFLGFCQAVERAILHEAKGAHDPELTEILSMFDNEECQDDQDEGDESLWGLVMHA